MTGIQRIDPILSEALPEGRKSPSPDPAAMGILNETHQQSHHTGTPVLSGSCLT